MSDMGGIGSIGGASNSRGLSIPKQETEAEKWLRENAAKLQAGGEFSQQDLIELVQQSRDASVPALLRDQLSPERLGNNALALRVDAQTYTGISTVADSLNRQSGSELREVQVHELTSKVDLNPDGDGHFDTNAFSEEVFQAFEDHREELNLNSFETFIDLLALASDEVKKENTGKGLKDRPVELKDSVTVLLDKKDQFIEVLEKRDPIFTSLKRAFTELYTRTDANAGVVLLRAYRAISKESSYIKDNGRFKMSELKGMLLAYVKETGSHQLLSLDLAVQHINQNPAHYLDKANDALKPFKPSKTKDEE